MVECILWVKLACSGQGEVQRWLRSSYQVSSTWCVHVGVCYEHGHGTQQAEVPEGRSTLTENLLFKHSRQSQTGILWVRWATTALSLSPLVQWIQAAPNDFATHGRGAVGGDKPISSGLLLLTAMLGLTLATGFFQFKRGRDCKWTGPLLVVNE